MATEKWIAGSGQGLTWGNAFTSANLASIPNASSLLSDVAVTNGTALDIFADVSVSIGPAAVAAPFFMGVYLLPLNADGATYGNGSISTTTGGTAGNPGSVYYVGSLSLATSSSSQSGTLQRVVMPPGTFKFALYNQSGATLASGSANTCQYRTYNRSVA